MVSTRAISVLLAVAAVAALLPSSLAQCIMSSTECTCSYRSAASKICLRYESGTTGNEMCTSYDCGEGYICDCAGTEMCDRGSCPGGSSSLSYYPVGNAPATAGVNVACRSTSSSSCTMIRASPAATPAASPAPSVSSGPSPSPSPSTSVPSILGTACNSANPDDPVCGGASSDYACGAEGTCTYRVTMTIRMFADDHAHPIVNGAFQGTEGPNQGEKTWTYNGPCARNVIIQVRQGSGRMYVGGGVNVVVPGLSSNFDYVTNMAIGGRGVQNPSDMTFVSNPLFDFTQWSPAVSFQIPTNGLTATINQFLADIGNGAVIWSTQSDGFAPDNMNFFFNIPIAVCN